MCGCGEPPVPRGCRHPQDTAPGIWGPCCSPPGMDLPGEDLGRGKQRSALPDTCSRVDSARGRAAAGFANAAA